jgi:cyclopropane-fatty-acyl-phospholipid synthase
MLDDTMMYSSGVFEHSQATLKEASLSKLDRICKKLQLNNQDHVIEIGTGWGGFAVHAAEHYGCRVTTTTISDQQYQYAKALIEQKGLTDRITLLKKDYRELKGRFDKLVSIEMIEAVGHQYYGDYFAHCASLLKDNGAALIQAITIQDQRFSAALKEVDFIQRYIFPGSNIPSITAICNAATHRSDLKLSHLEDIGYHYALTLEAWRKNFFRHIEQVKNLGFSEEFIRMWEFYLSYCEGGFRERWIGDAQLVFTKPGCRIKPIVVNSDAYDH